MNIVHEPAPMVISGMAMNAAKMELGSIEAVLDTHNPEANFSYLYWEMKEKREADDIKGVAKYMRWTAKQDFMTAKRPEYQYLIEEYHRCANYLRHYDLRIILGEEI